jgi:hypothetical protein
VVLRAHLDAVVLVLSQTRSGISVAAAGPTEVAGRMRASLAAERTPFMEHYRQFRYAFPERASDVVEDVSATEARLLSALFDNRPAASVAHPYPCDIAALGAAVTAAAREVAGRPDSRTGRAVS